MAQHLSSPEAEEKHRVLAISFSSFVSIKYEFSTTWIMHCGCSFKMGAFVNLSVIMHLLLTSSGIWGLQLRELISENSVLNASISIIHLPSLWNHRLRSCSALMGLMAPPMFTAAPCCREGRTCLLLFVAFAFCLSVCFLLTGIHNLRRTWEQLPESILCPPASPFIKPNDVFFFFFLLRCAPARCSKTGFPTFPYQDTCSKSCFYMALGSSEGTFTWPKAIWVSGSRRRPSRGLSAPSAYPPSCSRGGQLLGASLAHWCRGHPLGKPPPEKLHCLLQRSFQHSHWPGAALPSLHSTVGHYSLQVAPGSPTTRQAFAHFSLPEEKWRPLSRKCGRKITSKVTMHGARPLNSPQQGDLVPAY